MYNFSTFNFSFSMLKIWEHYAFNGLSSCASAFGWTQEEKGVKIMCCE